MTIRPKNKHFLEKLDEFLAAFDPEELLRDGIDLIKFNYRKGSIRYTETFNPEQLRKERGRRCNL